eukprot:2398823-Amphidinium_carterae.1
MPLFYTGFEGFAGERANTSSCSVIREQLKGWCFTCCVCERWTHASFTSRSSSTKPITNGIIEWLCLKSSAAA